VQYFKGFEETLEDAIKEVAHLMSELNWVEDVYELTAS
jgi:hypothetical protein